MKHTINLDDIQSFVASADLQWHSFASTKSKKLQIAIGKKMFRVLREQEIMVETPEVKIAVSVYNNI